jgi:hypothetical protein
MQTSAGQSHSRSEGGTGDGGCASGCARLFVFGAFHAQRFSSRRLGVVLRIVGILTKAGEQP